MTLMVPHPARTVPNPSICDQAVPHRWTLDEYLSLSESGFFNDRKVELIDGEIIDMAAQLDAHMYSVTKAVKWCDKNFPDNRFWVRGQATLLTSESSPEPDVAIVNYPPTAQRQYASADQAVLVIEVSDTTLMADTTTKMSLYASAGLKDYWVVSIPDRQVIVHREPIAAPTAKLKFAYADVRRYGVGQLISPLAMPSATLDPQMLLD